MSDEIITLDSDDESNNSYFAEKTLGRLPPGTEAIRSESGSRKTLGFFKPKNCSYKRPGQVPPFSVFSTDHRAKLQESCPELSFGDIGRKLGEMWHNLTDFEKESYRYRAQDIGFKKLRDWEAKMTQSIPPPKFTAPSSSSSFKRRRTHGYAIFMSEERKKYSTLSIPVGNVTRKVAEAWRALSQEARGVYESKANTINSRENRRFSLQQFQRYPPPLKIASFESLSRKPTVNLPSGITISRVEPEISIISEQTKASSSPYNSVIDLRGLSTSRRPPSLPPSRTIRPELRPPINKRLSLSSMTQSSSKRHRLYTPGVLGTLDSWDRVCRLCGRTTTPSFKIRDEIGILEKVREYLGLRLQLEEDENNGYPSAMCRKCSGMLNAFDKFKGVVSEGQRHLDTLAKAKDCPILEVVSQFSREESILPDLEEENHLQISMHIKEETSTIDPQAESILLDEDGSNGKEDPLKEDSSSEEKYDKVSLSHIGNENGEPSVKNSEEEWSEHDDKHLSENESIQSGENSENLKAQTLIEDLENETEIRNAIIESLRELSTEKSLESNESDNSL